MSTLSLVHGKEPSKEALAENQEIKYKIYFGVFFDGTSNNMIQGKIARKIRREHAKSGKKGLLKWTSYGWNNRHKSENELLSEKELKDIEDPILQGSFKDGYDRKWLSKHFGKDGGFSNIAILFSKYRGGTESQEKTSQNKSSNEKIIVYKIYVEGSGANDIKQWNTGVSSRGLGFGVGKTGVVALVSKAVSAVESRLKFFNGINNNITVNLYFDVFGFSRGAACARLFSYLVAREKDVDTETSDKTKPKTLDREEEFSKYYCKHLYDKNSKRLSFLDDYRYFQTKVPPVPTPPKTKEISFLGIFDTVVSIGMLRRKNPGNDGAENPESDGTNNFFDKNNVINPLRAGFGFDRDFDGNLHDLNAKEYGMYSPQLGVPTFHICAMDEFRENFALTDVGEIVPKNSLELFLPGCHSDIGGGYICNNEEKIVLNKYPTFSLEGLPAIKPEKGCAQIFISKPQSESGIYKPLGIDAIRELGWLPKEKENGIEEQKKSPLLHNKAKVDKIDTNDGADSTATPKPHIQGIYDKEGKLGEYEWWDRGDKIGWKRTVPSFFSNLPLRLMAERASLITGRMMFTTDSGKCDSKTDGNKCDQEKDYLGEEFYDVPSGLKDFYNKVKDKVKQTSCGNRIWVFPGGGYSSEDYRKIRLFYLHFTAEQKLGISRLWDVQNSTKVVDYYNVISRIVYHGNKEDSGNMHYMFNYNGEQGDFTYDKLC